LDVEISRRFSDWFSVHMSNFEFRWPPWQEWCVIEISLSFSLLTVSFSRVPDLDLPNEHPRKAFIRRVLDKEIRLAYYDRILRTVPESFHAQEAGVLPEQVPGPEFDYSDPSTRFPGLTSCTQDR
jgi:nuclear cap-binding protein subunit 1